ncbi:DnaA N-terminal domain-containing protein [Tepidibacillus sp. LV47]
MNERELIIEAEIEFARDWLESRYASLIDEAIDEVKSDIDSKKTFSRK